MSKVDILQEDIQVTVLMPVFNGEHYLATALESVLSQTGIDSMEILVINDGSKDSSATILDGYKDPRLKVIHQSNIGLAATLNKGIRLARGRYIARQDQDDLMVPGRLDKQFTYLESYPEIAMVGTWAQIRVGDLPDGRLHEHPTDSGVLKARLLFDNPFVHSSVMMRTKVALEMGGYSEDRSRQPPEDYEFWSRIARQHMISNLPEILTIYREVPSSMSRVGVNPFLSKVLKISSENLYAVLSTRWTLDDCLSLACLYHAAPGSPRRISRAEALEMTQAALMALAGSEAGWSTPMIAEAKRLKTHISSRFLQKIIPLKLRGLAHWFYKSLSIK